MRIQLLNEIWNVMDPSDTSTWPEHEQKIYYIFTPLGKLPIFEGTFYHDEDRDGDPYGCYVADCGGFCDGYDAPLWRSRDA